MSAPRLVLASNNRGKLGEFARLLDGCGFELVTPADLGQRFEVEETGDSFAANARLKAEAAAALTGLPALADDSGIEIDALGGRPGIYSARYAGGDRTSSDLTEEQQVDIVLEEMRGVPDDARGARFRCVIAIAVPGRATRTVEGVFEGRIAHEPRGANGFGYDPIFLVPSKGVTSAQLDPDTKNAMSHRGQAARKALPLLRELAHGRD